MDLWDWNSVLNQRLTAISDGRCSIDAEWLVKYCIFSFEQIVTPASERVAVPPVPIIWQNQQVSEMAPSEVLALLAAPGLTIEIETKLGELKLLTPSVKQLTPAIWQTLQYIKAENAIQLVETITAYSSLLKVDPALKGVKLSPGFIKGVRRFIAMRLVSNIYWDIALTTKKGKKHIPRLFQETFGSNVAGSMSEYLEMATAATFEMAVHLSPDYVDLSFFTVESFRIEAIDAAILPNGEWFRPKEEVKPTISPIIGERLNLDELWDERSMFYRTELGCQVAYSTTGYLGSNRYIAFQVTAADGRVFVICDSVVPDNAIYLFHFEGSNTQSWQADAEKTKLDLLTTPGQTCFIQRMYHSGKWQERLKQFLRKV